MTINFFAGIDFLPFDFYCRHFTILYPLCQRGHDTRAEAKCFLTCEWTELKIIDNSPQPSRYHQLIERYFEAKIKANELELSTYPIITDLKDCHSFKTAIEYFNFICNNRKYIKNNVANNNENIHLVNNMYDRFDMNVNNNFKNNEIKDITKYIKNEYIDLKKDFDFKIHSYNSLKQLSNEWHIKNILKHKFNYYYEKRDIGEYFNNLIVEDYFDFILHNIKKIENSNEISDISDFLKYEYIDTDIDFDFNNRTWDNLKRLSDEWHLENRMGPSLKKCINTIWEKSLIKDFNYEKEGKIWTIIEITSGKLLHEESQSMHHCCFSYINECINKKCIIFPVKCKNNNGKNAERVATVEVSKNMELIQARKEYNRHIDKETEGIIKQWASENNINFNSIFSRNIDFNENDN